MSGRREKGPREVGPATADEDPLEGEMVREVTARAIRRLDLLEYGILGVAALLAVVAGALVALLASELTPLPFRTAWTVASIACFVIPAALVRWRSGD